MARPSFEEQRARGPSPVGAKRPVLLVGCLLALAGCTVGPDYRGPPDTAPLARSAPTFRRSDPVDVPTLPPARWWQAMNDPVLADLVERALLHSPTLRAAQARILQARASLAQQRAGAYPSATATGAAIRADVPAGSPLASLGGSGGSSTASGSGGTAGGGGAAAAEPAAGSADTTSGGREQFSFYSAGFDAIWEFDLFGGVRRGVEGARARADAASARYEDAQVQLAAEVGQAYVALRGQQALLALAERNQTDQRQLVELTQQRRRFGTADDFDVERAQAQLVSTRAEAAPLPGQLAESFDQLALLVGQEPGTLDALLSTPAPVPSLPETVAVGDPAAMLQRRPDVRAAERTLASSNAAVGQAVARRFPSVTLFGNIGYSGGQASKLFDVNNLAAFGGPILRWNFLDFGGTRAQVDQSRAANAEALANYDSAVLSALQDAESSLARFGRQRLSVLRRTDARDSTVRALGLAQTRYQGGTATLLDVLTADTQRLQSERALAEAQVELVRDYVALQKSLGLGWQSAGEPVALAPR